MSLVLGAMIYSELMGSAGDCEAGDDAPMCGHEAMRRNSEQLR